MHTALNTFDGSILSYGMQCSALYTPKLCAFLPSTTRYQAAAKCLPRIYPLIDFESLEKIYNSHALRDSTILRISHQIWQAKTLEELQ